MQREPAALRLAALLIGLLAPCLATASPSFGRVDGTYHKEHRISTFEEERKADDTLTLEHQRGGYHFSVALMFDYEYGCNLSGDAITRDADSVRTLIYTPPASSARGDGCQLQIELGAQTITLHDPENTCRAFCGMGGSFEGAEFSRATRTDK